MNRGVVQLRVGMDRSATRRSVRCADHGMIRGLCVVPECEHYEGAAAEKNPSRQLPCQGCRQPVGSGTHGHGGGGERYCAACRGLPSRNPDTEDE